MQVGDFLKVLEYYNTKSLIDTGGSYRACCPIHNGHNPTAFVINKENNLWHCHAGCGGGDMLEFIMIKEGIGFKQARKKLSEILQISEQELFIHDNIGLIEKDTKRWAEFVHNTNHNFNEYDLPDVKLYNLNSYRDFDAEILKQFGVKYAKTFPITNKNGEIKILHDRIIFPLYFYNTLVGVTLRRVNNKNFPKWLHQPTHIDTGSILYNYDNIEPFKPIGIVEGILDVFKYYKIGVTNVVATFGANLTKEQEKLLIKKTDSIWLSYDKDDAGIKATNKAIKRLRYKANLRIIDLPEDNDPCDIENGHLLELYNNMKRVI